MSKLFGFISNGGGRLVATIIGWVALVVIIGFWTAVIANNLLWENYKIAIFVNGMIPLSGIRLSVVAAVVILMELISPGFTIYQIMDLKNRPDISWQNKAVAAAFILGVMWITLKCMSTQFVGDGQ